MDKKIAKQEEILKAWQKPAIEKIDVLKSTQAGFGISDGIFGCKTGS